MINKELKLKYIKSLKSGGRVPKYQTAWGKLDRQDKLDDWTNNWQFRTTPLSKSKILGGWKEGSRRGHVETSEEYTKRRIKEEEDATKKRTKHIRKVADTAHMIGTLATGAGAAGLLLTNPVTTLGAIAGGIAGEKAVDYGLGKLADVTGSKVRSWKDLTDKYLGWSPTLQMFTNPGTIIGGGIGAKGAQLGKGAMDYLIAMDMARYGHTPTTRYYFKPGYLGINGGAIGKIPEVPEGYTFIKEVELSGKNGKRKVHLVRDNSSGKTKILEDIAFKSDLDWSKNWFEAAGRKYKDGSPTEYTDKDIKKLESHIPEYIEIERKAKADGTWLKMPDGSTWEGDPRSWVQYKSEAVQKQNPEIFATGIHKEIDPNYNEQLWGLPFINQSKLALARARTYVNEDSKVFPMFTKKQDAKQSYTFNAEGSYWQAIKDKNGGYKTTDDIVDQNSKKKLIKINNVIDIGDHKVPTNSKYYYEGIGNNEQIPQNDIVIQPNVFRKSLIGNNGDFKHPTNMFRGLIPLSILGLGYSMFNE